MLRPFRFLAAPLPGARASYPNTGGVKSVGGPSWAVCRGSNGLAQVFSFARTGNTSSGAIVRWLRSNGRFGDIPFGYELALSSAARAS
jgi:hypothetical protein